MRKIYRFVYAILSVLFLLYLLLPQPQFPEKLINSLRSEEPADVESFYRQGFYVNGVRSEVIEHYKNEFNKIAFMGIKFELFSLGLNYPPEEAQTIIRDQTRSTYLEEVVHPFRESLYVSGFEPKKDSDKIIVNGTDYQQKVIVKMIRTPLYVRMAVGIATVFLGYFVLSLWIKFINNKINISNK